MAEYEPIVGRYLKLDLGGRPHRLYFEEAGQGIPLVCLHTAGADSRQCRHLLNDAEITRHFRVLAFDMPWHGKSLPPVGWQDEEYRLTTQGYIDLILAFIRALGLERPVVIGCSIGGKIVLELARLHAATLPRADRARVRRLPGALVRRHRLAAPARRARRRGRRRDDVGTDRAAEPERDALGHAVDVHEGGPGVFKGDLFFYRVDGDFRDRVSQIDTGEVPALPADRRVRLLVHARGHGAHRRQDQGRAR